MVCLLLFCSFLYYIANKLKVVRSSIERRTRRKSGRARQSKVAKCVSCVSPSSPSPGDRYGPIINYISLIFISHLLPFRVLLITSHSTNALTVTPSSAVVAVLCPSRRSCWVGRSQRGIQTLPRFIQLSFCFIILYYLL